MENENRKNFDTEESESAEKGLKTSKDNSETKGTLRSFEKKEDFTAELAEVRRESGERTGEELKITQRR